MNTKKDMRSDTINFIHAFSRSKPGDLESKSEDEVDALKLADPPFRMLHMDFVFLTMALRGYTKRNGGESVKVREVEKSGVKLGDVVKLVQDKIG